MSVEWPFTRLGLTFFDGTLPKLVRALERIATVMEKEHLATTATAGPVVDKKVTKEELLMQCARCIKTNEFVGGVDHDPEKSYAHPTPGMLLTAELEKLLNLISNLEE